MIRALRLVVWVPVFVLSAVGIAFSLLGDGFALLAGTIHDAVLC